MNNVSKVKIAVGYTLLLAVLFFSLFFVHRKNIPIEVNGIPNFMLCC